MALTKLAKIDENSFWAIWKIEEPLSQLYTSLEISPNDLQYLEAAVHHPKKKLEWMAGRLALQSLLHLQGRFEWELLKDRHGKPYLLDHSYHISLANSYPFATAILHKKQAVGIDMEYPSEKLWRVRNKFLNQTELQRAGSDLDLLCIFWCAKECVYKIHGHHALSFKDHIFIQDFNPVSHTLSASALSPETHVLHQLAYEQVENFYIVYNL